MGWMILQSMAGLMQLCFGGNRMANLLLKSGLFGRNIDPSCSYCENGSLSSDGSMILCSKKGIVSPYYSCRKFCYAPLKRIPKRPRPLPKYSEDEFSL